MAEPTIVTWNFANWITIVLMVAIGFAFVGFVARLVQTRKAA